jgi:hypothetical protein
MNIYEKLQQAKYDLQTANLKKTGENKFAHYDYWELSDFQPTIVSLFLKAGLCSYISFSETLAILTIVNIEKTDEIIILTSPMAPADLKGCHAIQNMGAVETYSRRYLYMAALDISEPDALDASQGSPQSSVAANKLKGQNYTPKITESTTPPEPPKVYECFSCKKPFTDFTHNGKKYTSGQAFHMSENKYGGIAYCFDCGKTVPLPPKEIAK